MDKKTEEEVMPFNANEVRTWLHGLGETVGTRGRIAVSKHRAYLDANAARARQIAKELGTMPKNNQLKDKDLDATAFSMARPGLRGKASEPVAETSAA
jgi:hypothetical protein